MRNEARLPPWLVRRGYTAQLEMRLRDAAKAKRTEQAPDGPALEAEPQGVGRAIEPRQYLTWRMAKAG